jgi:serine/threonine-protein kinase
VDTQFLDCCPGETPREEDDEDSVVSDDDQLEDPLGESNAETVRALACSDTGRAYPVGAVLGSYRLLQQIGAGGMGRVFVAEHVRLGRRVALKVLRSEFSGNLEAVKRFFAEARSVNCISHENIIEVSDFVESHNGPSFYIMELLHGQDLRGVQEQEGILPTERILRIGAQICSGLGAAHAAGIVHRDLKPDNIFLIERNGQRDFVKLLDFGVAKLNANFEEAATFRSMVGMVVGTPDYMAPEQALGHAVDHRADIYATGVILYEMVAGRRPFVATSAREVMVQHLTTTPCRPSRLNPAGKIPEELEELILSCLAKEPGHRPQEIQEVEQRLRDILAELPALGGRRHSLRRPKPLKLAGAAALMALLATTAWIGSGSPLFASTPSIAAARERLRMRITGNRGAPKTLQVIASARTPFTIEHAGDPSIARLPPTPRAPVPGPVAPPAARAPAPAPVPAAAVEKISRKPPASAAPGTQPPPFNERRHPKLDRDLVLDPFE